MMIVDSIIIMGLILLGIPTICLLPWWLKEVRKIGDERQFPKEVS